MRGVPFLACVGVMAGCGGAVASGPDAATPPTDAPQVDAAPSDAGSQCEHFDDGEERGRVASAALAEISGVVASRAYPGVLWVHNDSGGGPHLFAISHDGASVRGEWVLEGASDVDWEDIAIEVREGAPHRVWIGDIGDNDARDGGSGRDHVTVLRVEEPAIPSTPGAAMPIAYESITVRYPDRAHDAEAMAIDPATGDLYVFAKENGGPSDVFVARAPISEDVVLERVATIDAGFMVTGADISPDARDLLVRTYLGIQWWTRGADETWASALGRAPMRAPSIAEPQGESVAFLGDGQGYLTISEGVMPPIWFFARCAE